VGSSAAQLATVFAFETQPGRVFVFSCRCFYFFYDRIYEFGFQEV